MHDLYLLKNWSNGDGASKFQQTYSNNTCTHPFYWTSGTEWVWSFPPKKIQTFYILKLLVPKLWFGPPTDKIIPRTPLKEKIWIRSCNFLYLNLNIGMDGKTRKFRLKNDGILCVGKCRFVQFAI